MLTEDVVIVKLTEFKNKLIKFRDERDAARRELESVKAQLSEKEQLIDSLTTERQESLTEIESIHTRIDNLQKLYEMKDKAYIDLKDKTYHTIKHLVEDNIEVKESQIADLMNQIDSLKKDLGKSEGQLNESQAENSQKLEQFEIQINELKTALEQSKSDKEDIENSFKEFETKVEKEYISKEAHLEEINRILEEKSRSDEEKQTVLSNTWKEQVKTSEELRATSQKLEEVQSQLDQEKTDNENLRKSLADKTTEFDTYKVNTEIRIQELEKDAKKIDTDTQLDISRLTEKVKSLTTIKEELENKNKDLIDKIQNLENALAKKEAQVEKPTSVPERSVISKETIPYKFGSTTASVMQKAKNFVEELYKDSVQMNNVYILGNPKEAADAVGLTEKEYTVFMNRFAECLEYDGVPLLYQQSGEWKSNLSKVKLIDFISTVSGK
jgi:chromosome segregation ATPase